MVGEIKIWAQMFFDDGSVSEGVRVDIDVLEDLNAVANVSEHLLKSTNRDEGFLLLWGAGNIRFYNINNTIDESSTDKLLT